MNRLTTLSTTGTLDGALALMHADVEWSNGMEGGFVHGHDGVRAYWTRQWTLIDPHVEPVAFSVEDDGRIRTEVRQLIKDLPEQSLLPERCTIFIRSKTD